MKTKRMIALALAALLLLLTFAGCAQKNPDAPASAKLSAPVEGPKLADLKATDKLVIYIMQVNETFDRQLINQFSAHYGVDVEVVAVEGDAFAYAERVMNDLASGSGPDVLFTENLSGLDVSKVAMSHNFLDLTDVLAEDPDFSEDDYVTGVFEAGRFGDRQYTIPVAYALRLTFSSTETLKKLGFNWDKITTMSDYLKEIARLTPVAKQDASFQQMLYSKNSLNKLLWASGISLLDYEKSVVLPDEETLSEYLHAYKAYFLYDDFNQAGMYMSTVSNFGAKDLMRGKYFFWPVNAIADLTWNIDTLEEESYGYALSVLPSQTGEIVGSIYGQMAINANSKNQLNAYHFIKMMLSKDVQSSRSPLFYYVPIHKEAIKAIIYGAYSFDVAGTTYGGHRSASLSEEELDAVIKTITGVDRFTQQISVNAVTMMWDTMLPFFKDERSYEDCFAELRNKLTFYLSE